jgi:bifunctional non-homologous end joining protein LigD
MGIRSIRKTSSATGVQIYVPIVRGYTFEQLRTIGHFVGSYVVQKHRQRKTWQKRQERRKRYIRYNRYKRWKWWKL